MTWFPRPSRPLRMPPQRLSIGNKPFLRLDDSSDMERDLSRLAPLGLLLPPICCTRRTSVGNGAPWEALLMSAIVVGVVLFCRGNLPTANE